MFSAQREAQRIEQQVLQRRSAYETHARDTGFGIRFGEKTCFDHIQKDLVIGVADLLQSGVKTIAGFDFAVLHEIKHYLDMKQDPESYAKLLAKGTRADGLGQLYFRLYNCTEDVSVNERNRHDSALFRGENGAGFSDEVRRLYQKALFAERNFARVAPGAKHPERLFCAQYADFILNMGMGVSGDVTVSPEVRAVLEREIDVYGRRYSTQSFVDMFLRPAPLGQQPTPGNSLKMRLQMVERYLEPRFVELLELDKKIRGEEGLKKQAQEGSGGAPKGSSIDDLKKALEVIVNEAKENAKTPADRAKELLRKQQLKAGEEAGLSEEEAKDFADRLSRLQPIIQQLGDFWLSVPQVSREITTQYEGPYRSGVRVDVRRLVAEYAAIEHGDPNLEIMQQLVEASTESASPKRMRVRLVVDASGSMKDHMETVADLAVALGASFVSANAAAEMKGLDFVCEAQCVTFGINSTEILPPTAKVTLSDLMKMYPKFFQYEDDTNDHLALEHILNSLDPRDAVVRKSGEVFDLVLELTDGDTMAPVRSIAALEGLEKAGLVTRAFCIGGSGRFDDVWNSAGVKRGEKIASAREILPALVKLLQAEIGALRERVGGGTYDPRP